MGCLRFTDVNLKLISDIEKYEFVESITRDDISTISKSYAEANNKFLKSYNVNLIWSRFYFIYHILRPLEVIWTLCDTKIQFIPTKILDCVKDILKSFDDFKNKQKIVWSNGF